MRKKKQTVIFLVIAAVIVAAFVVLSVLSNRISPIPKGTVGNTAGNLNNGGLFCEHDGKVYFSNAYDNGTLYSMNPDESNIKKLNNSSVEYINAGGKYLVYYQDGPSDEEGFGFLGAMKGVYRSNLKGRNTVCLDNTPSGTLILVDDQVYYSHYDTETQLTLWKTKLNKTGKEKLYDYWINPASCENGFLYFNGTGRDHNLYSLNTADDTVNTVWETDIWNPVVLNGYVYYMDVPNNYRLCRYSFAANTIEILTEDRVDFFNVYDSYIYYQKSSQAEPALKRMHLDGSGAETVMEGIFENISITSEYVYFNAFEQAVPVYRTSTYGPVDVTTFENAKIAAVNSK